MGIRTGKHARITSHSRMSYSTKISLAFSFTVAFAAVAAALMMRLIDADMAPAPHEPAPAPVASAVEPIIQQGRLVAVSPTSLTAQGPDGVARTYLVDGQTHGITAGGSQLGGTAKVFSVNDEVSIIGITRGTDNVAMTIAHRDVAALNGPPMDYALP